MLVQHAQCMEDRRHELLEVVRKRVHSWKTSKDLPPPKRIALTPLKLESLNVAPAPQPRNLYNNGHPETLNPRIPKRTCTL
ncbi:hypothetical protein DIPPA_09958 [Diplonema papillatum]|nr:hypothetical protein DIPPA_09958 [Diplonema papillatum]